VTLACFMWVLLPFLPGTICVMGTEVGSCGEGWDLCRWQCLLEGECDIRTWGPVSLQIIIGQPIKFLRGLHGMTARDPAQGKRSISISIVS
jgi:hypothetical protein